MPAVPLVQTVYVVVYPQGRQGYPGVAESNYNLQTAVSETGLPFVPVFTDEELGEQWIARQNLADATTHNLSVPVGFIDFLRLLREKNGPGHVGYDPIPGTFEVLPNATVLAELRKSSVDPDKATEPTQAGGYALGPVVPYPAPDPPPDDEVDSDIREVSSVVWAKIKRAMADRKAKGGSPPSVDS